MAAAAPKAHIRTPTDTPVAQLTRGLLEKFESPIADITSKLSDLSVQQIDLADATAAESEKFSRVPEGEQSLQDMIDTTKVYHNKLENARRDMALLTERSKEMRARAMRLQESKQREALRRESKRIKEREREEMLLAKPAETNK